MKTDNIRLVRSAIYEHNEKFGLKRGYPPNGIPKTREKIDYTEEEKEILDKPLLYHARRPGP